MNNTIYDKIEKLAYEIINYNEIKDYEIPDIDLYMDQVTSFMDSKLSDFKRNKDDIILSKTMINNYVKDKVVPSPNKKKYSKEHMMVLIWIYHLKQTLSINDIGKLMNFIYEKEKNNIDYTEIYNIFLELQKKSSKSFKMNLDDMFEAIKSNSKNFNDNEKLLLLVLELILNANLQKRLAEKIIDNCFSDSK
ncbi:DUF1836 domain-containing protein [Clostridium neuense]|uniref:DUF1836 domain-containing protein n=1 Tax=Clostridium neuense TaxID=1728934 RepID=A0ABW8TD64_9CLOT